MTALFVCKDGCSCLLCKIEDSVRLYQETGINANDWVEPVNAGANVGPIHRSSLANKRRERQS